MIETSSSGVRSAIVPVNPSAGTLYPLGIESVTLTSGFWADRQSLIESAFLPHCGEWIARMGWVENFDIAAAGRPSTDRRGKDFTDSDVYKYLEAVAWELGRQPNSERDAQLRAISSRIAAAQEPDGYLNTYYGHRGDALRYRDLSHGHELYCAGHLLQAVVARLRAYGEDELTAVGMRVAVRICEDFGAQGNPGYCGHPEVELGLVELFRATGDRRFLDQAVRFIERRGHRTLEPHPIGWEYYQDDMPVRDATVFRGHVVRSQYLAAAAVDVAIETDDTELLDAIVRQWEATSARRTYLTGGLGARHLGESFGNDYELPPDRAYTETCGAVASIMVAWRLLLATGEARFADAIERALFNMVATSLDIDADRFFYVNPLHQRQPGIAVADDEVPFRKDTLRAPWFWVSCCPTNVARLLASLSAYVATYTLQGIQLHQYASGEVSAELEPGRRVRLSVETDYPWKGEVDVLIQETDVKPWRLSLRVPGWAVEGATLTIGDRSEEAHPGTVGLERRWVAGDRVQLRLPMAPRLTWPDPRIDALRSTVAVERGPLVYCLESADLRPEWRLEEVALDPGVQLEDAPIPPGLGSGIAVRATGSRRHLPDAAPWPFGAPVTLGQAESADLLLVPYLLWSNRGPSTMRIWIPSASGAGQ